MVYEQCRGILLKESDLVQRIAVLQKLIQDAVESRQWAGFDGYFNDLNEMMEEFAVLENERERVFAGVTGFYTIISGLPPDQRAEISEIYRSLKLEALRVQAAGDALMSYITSAKETMAGFFSIAFPDRSGKIYTPYGVPVSHDMRSMVLDQCF